MIGKSLRPYFLITVGGLLAAAYAYAVPASEQTLTLKDHVFTPHELVVAAGQKIKLTVINQDAAAAEFESSELNREKVIPGNGTTIIHLGPLGAGTYNFFDDYNRASTGIITAK